jgi:hypothetical protein
MTVPKNNSTQVKVIPVICYNTGYRIMALFLAIYELRTTD